MEGGEHSAGRRALREVRWGTHVTGPPSHSGIASSVWEEAACATPGTGALTAVTGMEMGDRLPGTKQVSLSAGGSKIGLLFWGHLW